MRLGFLQVYNEVDWIKYSILHALKFCDCLIITEGSQFKNFKEIPLHSDDGTLEIIKEMMEEYPKEIELLTTIRKFQNYRENQAANFNFALKKCRKGDYFITLDADEFYFDDFIEKIIQITDDGKVDYLRGNALNFAFSFKWKILYGAEDTLYPHQVLFKKNRKLKFKPTHKPVNYGPNYIVDKNTCLNHYKWVKKTERIRLRHLTSGYHENMIEWFENNWNKTKLEENRIYPYFTWDFQLKRYTGPHPEILKDHPWRNIEDLRKI